MSTLESSGVTESTTCAEENMVEKEEKREYKKWISHHRERQI